MTDAYQMGYEDALNYTYHNPFGKHYEEQEYRDYQLGWCEGRIKRESKNEKTIYTATAGCAYDMQ